MAKKEVNKTICSFCIESFPSKELFTVIMPMHRLPDGSHLGEYKTPSCEKCLPKNKDRYLSVSENPKPDKIKKPKDI
jgi:hypothetical protein